MTRSRMMEIRRGLFEYIQFLTSSETQNTEKIQLVQVVKYWMEQDHAKLPQDPPIIGGAIKGPNQ